MRRMLTVLTAAGSLALGGAVAAAGPAAAAPSDTALGVASAKSVHSYCGSASDTHPGKHKGWASQPSNERRNVGGACGPVDLP